MCQKGNTIACRLVPFFSVLYIGISLFVMLPTLAYACDNNGGNNNGGNNNGANNPRAKVTVRDTGANNPRAIVTVRDTGANNPRAIVTVRDTGGQRNGIYTIQVMRPDPNRSESQGQTVQSVRMSYLFQVPVDAATSAEQQTCIGTPDQNWHVQDTGRSLKFGSDVKFEVFVGSGCTGNNVTQQLYGQPSLHFQVPNVGDIKNSTCWMNLNNFPSGTVSGCNGK